MTLLDDLRAADAAMTPGPWTVAPYSGDAWWLDEQLVGDGELLAATFNSNPRDADAAGIALMRNALPRLLAVVAEVTYLHRSQVDIDDPTPYCMECAERSPCATTAALAALGVTP